MCYPLSWRLCLRGERITPRLVWENVREQVVTTPQGHLASDETVLDKSASSAIELVRRQYSGNAHAVIKGIGVVTCEPPRVLWRLRLLRE